MLLGLSSGDGDVIRGRRTILRGSGGIFLGIVVGPDLIRGSYSMEWYVWFFVYVYMVMVLHPYLHHIGEPQRDEGIRGQRRMLRGSGGIFFDIAVGPDLIRGGYSMQRYVFSYVFI